MTSQKLNDVRVVAFDCDGVMFDTGDANRAYYGREGLTPTQILDGGIENPRHNVLGMVLGV